MSRANRYFIPGHVYHITHRCHKKEFLLKLKRDRKAWTKYLFEAKKRYGLVVLNYMVTSNHIHLLVQSNDEETISKSMQLIAGRTAQDYNRRKQRKGAFWEDRYHATAIETGSHLARCMTYVDLNMVRAGAVQAVGEWTDCGLEEVLSPRQRYGLIDHPALLKLLEVPTQDALKSIYPSWLEEALVSDLGKSDDRWSRAIAVGSDGFIEKIRRDLGLSIGQHKIITNEKDAQLMEPTMPYGEDNTVPLETV